MGKSFNIIVINCATQENVMNVQKSLNNTVFVITNREKLNAQSYLYSSAAKYVITNTSVEFMLVM